jgi:undecaprenyl-diphosphatase
MKQITTLGSGISFVMMTLACVVFLIRHHKKEAILFSIALSMGVILNTVLKHAIQRPRPELSPLISETMSSFPSGHAMNSFIFFGLLSFFSYHFFRSKKLTLVITALSIVSILLVGFSRVYLGVHYPTDVLAGYVAGFWWFITILLIDRTLIFYRSFKKTE